MIPASTNPLTKVPHKTARGAAALDKPGTSTNLFSSSTDSAVPRHHLQHISLFSCPQVGLYIYQLKVTVNLSPKWASHDASRLKTFEGIPHPYDRKKRPSVVDPDHSKICENEAGALEAVPTFSHTFAWQLRHGGWGPRIPAGTKQCQ